MTNEEMIDKIRREIIALICKLHINMANEQDLGIFYTKIKKIVDFENWIEKNRETEQYNGTPIADLFKTEKEENK